MSLEVWGFILGFLGTFASIVWTYAHLDAKVQSFKEFKETMVKYSTEFFTRIEALERAGSAQSEINKNMEKSFSEIKGKLDTIEQLLRNRGGLG